MTPNAENEKRGEPTGEVITTTNEELRRWEQEEQESG